MTSFYGVSQGVEYGPRVTVPFDGLSTLADATQIWSSSVDNSILKYTQYNIELLISGTGSTLGYLDVRLSASMDSIVSAFSSWENSVMLSPVVFNASPQRYLIRVLAPLYWRFGVRNETGAVLTAGTLYYQGIRG